jgi:hypothetical protein
MSVICNVNPRQAIEAISVVVVAVVVVVISSEEEVVVVDVRNRVRVLALNKLMEAKD